MNQFSLNFIKLAGRPRKDTNFTHRLNCLEMNLILKGHKVKKGGYLIYAKDDSSKVFVSNKYDMPKLVGEYK